MDLSKYKIWLNVWYWNRDPSKKIILYDYQKPFEQSPTFQKEWTLDYSFQALSPLLFPIPPFMELFYAYHSPSFPYQVVDIYPVVNVLRLKQNGTYFIAYTSSLEGRKELPWNNIYVDKILINHLK